jgi:hypothetical protein
MPWIVHLVSDTGYGLTSRAVKRHALRITPLSTAPYPVHGGSEMIQIHAWRLGLPSAVSSGDCPRIPLRTEATNTNSIAFETSPLSSLMGRIVDKCVALAVRERVTGCNVSTRTSTVVRFSTPSRKRSHHSHSRFHANFTRSVCAI